MLSQPEPSTLLGAESLVSRAAFTAQGHGHDDHAMSQHDSYGSRMAADSAAAGAGSLDWATGFWDPTPQNFAEPLPYMTHQQEQLASAEQLLDPPGLMPQSAPGGGQFWDRLDDAPMQQQCFTAGYNPHPSEALHGSHAYLSIASQAWTADATALQGVAQSQHHTHPDHLAANSHTTATWPVSMQYLQQQQQRQQQIVFPIVKDLGPADFHTCASPPDMGLPRIVTDEQAVCHSSSLPEVDLTCNESDASDTEEQVMFEGQLQEPQGAGSRSWPVQNVPQMQVMSREAALQRAAGHERLLDRIQLNSSGRTSQ